jgi:GTPase
VNLGKFADNWLKNCGGQIRNGMVLVDPKSKPRATWTFVAEIWTFDGLSKIIKNNYQPVIHVGHIRQSAKIILDKNKLHPNDDENNKRATSIDEFHKSNPTSSEEEEKSKKKQ